MGKKWSYIDTSSERYEQWAAHVYEFSLGGIEAIRKKFIQKKEGAHGD